MGFVGDESHYVERLPMRGKVLALALACDLVLAAPQGGCVTHGLSSEHCSLVANTIYPHPCYARIFI